VFSWKIRAIERKNKGGGKSSKTNKEKREESLVFMVNRSVIMITKKTKKVKGSLTNYHLGFGAHKNTHKTKKKKKGKKGGGGGGELGGVKHVSQ